MLTPFFVYRIRNEMIKLNDNMSKLIGILSDGSLEPNYEPIKCKWCKTNILQARCPIQNLASFVRPVTQRLKRMGNFLSKGY